MLAFSCYPSSLEISQWQKSKLSLGEISVRLVLHGYISQLKPPKALEKLSERCAASINHHTWGSLGFGFLFPPIHPGLGRTDPYPAPAAPPIWPSQWRPLVKAHLWKLTITLSPSSPSARREGGGLYNWFLEHTSCFMCLYQSPKEMKGPPPPFSPSSIHLAGWKTTAKWGGKMLLGAECKPFINNTLYVFTFLEGKKRKAGQKSVYSTQRKTKATFKKNYRYC